MGLFSELRLLVFMRRISRELHRANSLKEFELSVAHPSEFKSYKKAGKVNAQPKMSGASVADVAEWNRQYLESHPPEDDVDEF